MLAPAGGTPPYSPVPAANVAWACRTPCAPIGAGPRSWGVDCAKCHCETACPAGELQQALS